MRKTIDRCVEPILAFLMAAIILLLFASVCARYLFLSPFTWAEEIARLLLVWVSFLGAYLAHRYGQHIAVTAILDRLPSLPRLITRLAAAALVLALMAVLTWFGTRYALAFLTTYSQLLGIPIGLVYAAMPVSAVLICIDVLAELHSDLRRGGWLGANKSRG